MRRVYLSSFPQYSKSRYSPCIDTITKIPVLRLWYYFLTRHENFRISVRIYHTKEANLIQSIITVRRVGISTETHIDNFSSETKEDMRVSVTSEDKPQVRRMRHEQAETSFLPYQNWVDEEIQQAAVITCCLLYQGNKRLHYQCILYAFSFPFLFRVGRNAAGTNCRQGSFKVKAQNMSGDKICKSILHMDNRIKLLPRSSRIRELECCIVKKEIHMSSPPFFQENS